MNARLMLCILTVLFLVMLAFPGMSQAASALVVPAHQAASPLLSAFAARAEIGIQPAVKCPSVYRVRLGETLTSIAARCGVTTTAIVKANGLRSTRVWPGQRIYIPAPISAPIMPYLTLPSQAMKP
ncbi:MAG: LysM peptidoglycan-binding domain-containing protein [Anaerolineae bacterium]